MDILAMARKVLAAQPFAVGMGIEISKFENGITEMTMPVQDAVTQQHGFVHGGAISALADNSIGFTAATALGNIVSVEMKINFVRPGIGEMLIARGEVLHSGKRNVVAVSKIYAVKGGEEKLCAIAQGTVTKTETEMKL